MHLNSNNKPSDIKIALPKLGTISFVSMRGRKKGERYVQRDGFGKEVKSHMITIEEDQPNYERIKFTFDSGLQKTIRKTTEEKWRREHEV